MNEFQVNQPSTLRERLRHDTRTQHERFDSAMSALDIGTEDGLGDFLSVQYDALATLASADGDDRAEAEDIRAELMAALAADLEALGRPTGLSSTRSTLKADPTAVLYILLGSRLGTQVLARTWTRTATGAALNAGRYLTLDSRKDAWRGFCARTGDTPSRGVKADLVVADAIAIFDHYLTVLSDTTARTAPVHLRSANG